jgi:RHS repeat-associated protein
VGNRLGFTGHERDFETGLDYMLARYYGSSLARFLSTDPGDDTYLDAPQSLNKYCYVRNNPLNLIDPSGKTAREDFYPIREYFAQNPAAAAGGLMPPDQEAAIEAAAHSVSATAEGVSQKGLAVTGLGIVSGNGPVAGAGAGLSAAAFIVTAAANGVAALVNTSTENVAAVATDVAEAATGAAMGKALEGAESTGIVDEASKLVVSEATTSMAGAAAAQVVTQVSDAIAKPTTDEKQTERPQR